MLGFLCACAGQLTNHDDEGIVADANSAETLTYRPTIQADLEGAGCTTSADCHGQPGVPMAVLPGPTTDEQWRVNFEEVRARAGNSPESMLLTKPTGLGGHPALLSRGSLILARWTEWIELGTPFEAE